MSEKMEISPQAKKFIGYALADIVEPLCREARILSAGQITATIKIGSLNLDKPSVEIRVELFQERVATLFFDRNGQVTSK